MQALRAGWPEAAPVFNRQMEFILCIHVRVVPRGKYIRSGGFMCGVKVPIFRPHCKTTGKFGSGKKVFLDGIIYALACFMPA